MDRLAGKRKGGGKGKYKLMEIGEFTWESGSDKMEITPCHMMSGKLQLFNTNNTNKILEILKCSDFSTYIFSIQS